jgi:hypothetical protein
MTAKAEQREHAEPSDYQVKSDPERLGNGEVVTTIRMPWAPGDRFYHAKDQTWWRVDEAGHLKSANPPTPETTPFQRFAELEAFANVPMPVTLTMGEWVALLRSANVDLRHERPSTDFHERDIALQAANHVREAILGKRPKKKMNVGALSSKAGRPPSSRRG